MKTLLNTMSLVLVLCMSLTMGAGAVSYVPEDITYQNLNGQQMAIKLYTLLPDQDPADLMEADFTYDGYTYTYHDMVKTEQTFSEEALHTETVSVNTETKDLEEILAVLNPTMEYDDGNASGTLALDHSTLHTEAAGYKDSRYTVTDTKQYTGLERNDSSLIEKTVLKNGRTLHLSNIAWSVESTALLGDELVPATYSAVATYSASASSKVATGYITTADYTGTITSSGTSGILYTVTYIGTPVEEAPDMTIPLCIAGGGCVFFAMLLVIAALTRKNTTVYAATGKGSEYDKRGRLRLKVSDPELRIDRLKHVPEGVLAIEVDEKAAKKLFGRNIGIRYYDRIFSHTVDTVSGSYWFKIDVGPAPGAGAATGEAEP